MKKKVLLMVVICILLLFGIVAVYWLTNNRDQTLPIADGSQIMILSSREMRIDGKFGVEQIKFEIPKNAELFTEYSTLLSSLKLRHCVKEYEMGGHYYMIFYGSGSPGDSDGIRILFNEDSDDSYIHVLMIQNGEDAAVEGKTYKVENTEAWKEAFHELLNRSEAYKVD